MTRQSPPIIDDDSKQACHLACLLAFRNLGIFPRRFFCRLLKKANLAKTKQRVLHIPLFIFLLIASLGAATQRSYAQQIDTFNIKKVSFLLPQPLPAWKYHQALTIQYLVPPRDWTTQIIAVPVINYTGKYTLPLGFNVQGGLSTLLISNRFTLGPFWNYSFDHLHVGAGYQLVFNYGFLNQFGFTTSITGWEQQPSATVGYSFQTMAVILRGDLYWSNGFNIKDGGNELPYHNSFVNGYSITASLEQRLWKNRVLSTGLKMYYCKYNIIAWPAFPVNTYKYWFPEFQLGLEF